VKALPCDFNPSKAAADALCSPASAAALLLQQERQAAAEALVAALVDSQAQHDASHRAKNAEPPGSFDQEGGTRQQRMEQCLSCCSPLMVRLLRC